MQLPPYIIDFIGTLLDGGWNDEELCNVVIKAMKANHCTRIPTSFGRRFLATESQYVDIGLKQSA